MEGKMKRVGRRAPCGGRQEPLGTAPATGDRLSGLADEVLLTIVRRLPVGEVVRMSILSRRWRRLPSLLPVVDFLDLSPPCQKVEGEDPDWHEVHRVLSVRWGLIRRCRISVGDRFQSEVPDQLVDRFLEDEVLDKLVDRLLEAIAAKGVRELHFCGGDPVIYYRHRGLHHLKSLLRLVLFQVDLTASLRRPGCADLRELRLENGEISDNVLGELLSTCLRLECLVILNCSDMTCPSIKPAPCLRYFEFDCTFERWDDVECVGIDVDAPNLDTLRLSLRPCCEKFVVRAPNLASLRFHLKEPSEYDPNTPQYLVIAEGLRSLMKDATNLLSLELHGSVVECLSIVPFPKSVHPSFHHLTKMFIHVSLQDSQQASCLATLLHRCSRLKVLTLHISEVEPCDSEVPFHPIQLFGEHQMMLQQMGCLNDQLERVAMFGLTGQIYEIKLACFFLMETCALEELNLSFRKMHKDALDVTEKHLTNLRKGSLKVKLKLNEMNY